MQGMEDVYVGRAYGRGGRGIKLNHPTTIAVLSSTLWVGSLGRFLG